MNRIYRKEYNVILRSFITKAFFGTIVVSSLFACDRVSKEELEAVEAEAKAAKEETEKVKKELGDKITALEGRTPADINAAQYISIQNAVGLKADGTLEPAVGGSLAKDVAGLKTFIAAIQANVGLGGAGDLDYTASGSLAKYVEELRAFQTAIQGTIGLDDVGGLDDSKGLAQSVRAIKIFRTRIQANIGINTDGTVDDSKGLAKTVAELPAKIVKGINALGMKCYSAKKTQKPQIEPTDL